MVTPPDIEAQILRFYHVEKWTIGTIARQLHIHHSVVRRVLAQAGLPRVGPPPRPSKIDAYLPFIRQTLGSFPTLTASRMYVMAYERGYRGSADHFRHLIACHRPRPKAEAYLRLRTLPGEEEQVDWAHFGHLEIGRARRPLMAFVMVLSYSRQIFLRFFLDARMENFLRGHVAAFEAWQGVPRVLYPDSVGTRKIPGESVCRDPILFMIRRGFLDPESRKDLIELARDGSAAHRLGRRANAILLLDDGMTCEATARVLFVDDDTVRTRYQDYRDNGIEGLANFGHEGSACRLTAEQQDALKTWIAATLPRTTREVGACISRACGIAYQTRSGLIALLHRLDMEHRKPKAISRKLDPAKQTAFINEDQALMNRIEADEAVVFADAVHPTHAVRPVGCWGPKDVPVAVEQSSGLDRLNIHGAIDLETGQTVIKDVLTVDALSTIMLLMAIEARYPGMRFVHVSDNARYHHAKLVQAWLARPGCRVKLHFVPPYCPHLNSIERLWGLMHRHITHNKCYARRSGNSALPC